MTEIKTSAWAVCDRVMEAQALLHDHLKSGRFTSDEIVRTLAALMSEEGLLRAMWEVGYSGPIRRRQLRLPVTRHALT